MTGRANLDRMLRMGVTCLAALVPSSCADSPIAPCAPQADVIVSVGDGLTPSVSWSPSCLVGYVGFERIEGQSRLGMFESYDIDNKIPSDRTYGGGQTATTTFTPGSTYRVTVGRIIEVDGIATLGTLDFTR